MDFWHPDHFDFADALNKEIWLDSASVQQQVQPVYNLRSLGAIGAQQSMLEDDWLAERGPLPWVPDLVGKQWREHDSLVIVGSAYAGFIREYSTRPTAMPLSQYVAASSSEDFQRQFLTYVVRNDPSYYMPIQNLCSEFGSASRLLLMDLCRVSLVKRTVKNGKRRDSSSSKKLAEDTEIFERYSESKEPAEWLWRRFVEGHARHVLALGWTAEHGLLRLFNRNGMKITQRDDLFHPKYFMQGAWTTSYADSERNLKYWLNHKTWWTVRGRVDGTERVWYILPVYHPAIHKGSHYDPGYNLTKPVLKSMLLSSAETRHS